MSNEPIVQQTAQLVVDDILPDALANALGNIIRAQREEWRREHEFAIAQKNVIIAELQREHSELRHRFEKDIDNLINKIEAILLNVKDGQPGTKGEKGDIGEQGLKGEKGDPGEQGIQGIAGIPGDIGERGITGENGKDGKDINIEEVKELIQIEVTKAVSEIEVPVGRDGEPGRDGIDGKDVDQEQVNKLIETVVREAVSELPLPKDGIPGEKGEAGKDGADVVGGFIDREGNGILTLTNGRTISLGILVGKNGTDGVDGKSIDRAEIETIVETVVDQKETSVPEMPQEITSVVGKAIALLAESPPVPDWRAKEITRVTKHDPHGRILEFERRMVNE